MKARQPVSCANSTTKTALSYRVRSRENENLTRRAKRIQRRSGGMRFLFQFLLVDIFVLFGTVHRPAPALSLSLSDPTNYMAMPLLSALVLTSA